MKNVEENTTTVVTEESIQEKESKVLVKIKINAKTAQKLKDAGVLVKGRNEAEIIKNQKKEAEVLEVDFYRYALKDLSGNKIIAPRTDAAMIERGDTGVHLGEATGCLSKVIPDLEKCSEKNVTGVHLFYKIPDEGPRLCYLEIALTDSEPIEISPEVKNLMDAILSRSYQFVHVWANPDNSITVNCGGALQSDEEMIRFLNDKEEEGKVAFGTQPR